MNRELAALLVEWLGMIGIVMLLTRLRAYRKPTPVGFKYPRREGIISLSIFIFILAGAFYFWIAPPMAGDEPTRRAVIAAIGVLPFLLALFVRRQPWRSIGWGKENLPNALRLAFGLGLLAIILRGKTFSLFNGFGGNEINTLVACLVISAAEETIFRGFIQLRLQSWLGTRWGWLVSAGLFALWQLPRLLLVPATLPITLPFALAQGLLLGWIMPHSGNIVTTIIYRTLSEWLFFVS